MDDKLFDKMIQEIDAMSADEYWSLYHDAEKLSDFSPEADNFIPVQFVSASIEIMPHTLGIFYEAEAISIFQDNYKETQSHGDDIWPKAA